MGSGWFPKEHCRMGKRRAFLLITILAIGIFIWQLPAILKAIPSRYVAAYLPAPVQALAEREHVETLPTAVASVDAGYLLKAASTPTPVNTVPPTATEPPPSTHSPSGNTVALSAGGTAKIDSDLEPSPTIPSTPLPSPTATSTPVPIPEAGRLGSVRHHFQTWNNCGPANLAMGLSYFDLFLTQDQTASGLKPDPEDRNVSPFEMTAFVNDQTDLAAIDRANGSLDTLRRLVANDFPVIVELGIDPPGEYRWMGWYGHYLLIVAYDDVAEQVWAFDSWFGTSETPGENADVAGREVSYSELDRYWRQFNRNYIVLFEPERRGEVEAIIGSDMDDHIMWQEALNMAQVEASSEPDNAFLWFNLGTVYNALGDSETAALAFDQARILGLPWRMLWYQFGPYEAYYQVGRYDDVLLLADLTLKDRPYFEESFYYKGLALEASGELRDARENLEKAVRFNPTFNPAVEALEQLDS